LIFHSSSSVISLKAATGQHKRDKTIGGRKLPLHLG
jgi:hypothetical protein